MKEVMLGEFEVISGKLIVTDPCYCKKDYPWLEIIKNVRNGQWRAKLIRSGATATRNAIFKLVACHSDCDAEDMPELTNGDIISTDVDSGTAGFYDDAHYQDDTLVPQDFECKENEEGVRWHRYYSRLAFQDPGASVIPYGVVSRTAYGDGHYYGCTRLAENKEVVYVELDFIEKRPYSYFDFYNQKAR